ncbi:MAG: hypothetical protein EXS01_05945 [Phycisphaerales bacterium]|nr:hypothetical protein [Phycisphaerales bacterium]
MSPTLATASDEVQSAPQVIRDDETVLLMIRPSAWFIVVSSMRALPAAAAAGVALMLASLDPSIPWDFRGALLASAAIIVARAAWQSVDWCVRLYVLTDRRIVVRRGVIPEVCECLLGEVAGIGQPRRRMERIGRTGSLAILRGPSIGVRRARRAGRGRFFEEAQTPASQAEKRRTHPHVRVEHELEWSVIRDSETVRQTILHAVSRYR